MLARPTTSTKPSNVPPRRRSEQEHARVRLCQLFRKTDSTLLAPGSKQPGACGQPVTARLAGPGHVRHELTRRATGTAVGAWAADQTSVLVTLLKYVIAETPAVLLADQRTDPALPHLGLWLAWRLIPMLVDDTATRLDGAVRETLELLVLWMPGNQAHAQLRQFVTGIIDLFGSLGTSRGSAAMPCFPFTVECPAGRRSDGLVTITIDARETLEAVQTSLVALVTKSLPLAAQFVFDAVPRLWLSLTSYLHGLEAMPSLAGCLEAICVTIETCGPPPSLGCRGTMVLLLELVPPLCSHEGGDHDLQRHLASCFELLLVHRERMGCRQLANVLPPAMRHGLSRAVHVDLKVGRARAAPQL